MYFQGKIEDGRQLYKSDRQTDVLLTEIKVITDLFVIVISNENDMCTCIYNNVNLLKSYDIIHYDKQLKSF